MQGWIVEADPDGVGVVRVGGFGVQYEGCVNGEKFEDCGCWRAEVGADDGGEEDGGHGRGSKGEKN